MNRRSSGSSASPYPFKAQPRLVGLVGLVEPVPGGLWFPGLARASESGPRQDLESEPRPFEPQFRAFASVTKRVLGSNPGRTSHPAHSPSGFGPSRFVRFLYHRRAGMEFSATT